MNDSNILYTSSIFDHLTKGCGDSNDSTKILGEIHEDLYNNTVTHSSYDDNANQGQEVSSHLDCYLEFNKSTQTVEVDLYLCEYRPIKGDIEHRYTMLFTDPAGSDNPHNQNVHGTFTGTVNYYGDLDENDNIVYDKSQTAYDDSTLNVNTTSAYDAGSGTDIHLDYKSFFTDLDEGQYNRAVLDFLKTNKISGRVPDSDS